MLPSDAIDTDGEAGIEVSAYREEGVDRVGSPLLAGADHHGIVEPRVVFVFMIAEFAMVFT